MANTLYDKVKKIYDTCNKPQKVLFCFSTFLFDLCLFCSIYYGIIYDITIWDFIFIWLFLLTIPFGWLHYFITFRNKIRNPELYKLPKNIRRMIIFIEENGLH